MQNNKYSSTYGMIMSALFVALIAVGTFIKIPIPVLPFTLQFLFTNLAGLILGSKRGAISVAGYILIGLIGIPVFSSGGGIGYVFQPTFGYLIGFMVGTYVAGRIIEKRKIRSIKSMLLASFVNLTVVYAIGMVYYYFIANYYLNTPIGVGMLIFYCFILAVPGDILLCFLSVILAKRLNPIIPNEFKYDLNT